MFRKKEPQPAGFHDASEVEAWLIAELARRLRVSPETLDAKQPLASLGLDSRTAIALSGDLEKIIGRELSPTLAWDHPTIEAIARHVMSAKENG
jgi:acyl carrier protein